MAHQELSKAQDECAQQSAMCGYMEGALMSSGITLPLARYRPAPIPLYRVRRWSKALVGALEESLRWAFQDIHRLGLG